VGGLGKGLSQAVIAAQGIRGFERGGERVGESDRGVGKEEKSAPLKSEGCGTRQRSDIRNRNAAWYLACSVLSGGKNVKTVAEWIAKHPHVKARMFERNYKKQSGSGKFETVCGFCLGSSYFRVRPRRNCKFCRAPLREARSISTLPEVLNQRWRVIGTTF